MSSTIIVEGHGRVSAEPDTVIIEGEIEFLADGYDEAVAGCASSVEEVRGSLIALGIDEAAIRTSGSSVRPSYKDDPDYEYGMKISHYEVFFKVSDRILTVTRVTVE